jgi:hypothetical protein
MANIHFTRCDLDLEPESPRPPEYYDIRNIPREGEPIYPEAVKAANELARNVSLSPEERKLARETRAALIWDRARSVRHLMGESALKEATERERTRNKR